MMGLSLNFYLSAVALLAGIAGGAYFFIEWERHRRLYVFPLFWAIGLFCLFLFQIPTILSSVGQHLVLTDFSTFFAIILPVSFLGLISIYLGILSLVTPIRRKHIIFFSGWLFASILYFAYFFREGSVFTSRLPLYGIIVLFFLPIHILNLIAVARLGKATRSVHSVSYRIGLAMIATSFLFGFARNALFLRGFSMYPPAFWFFVLQQPLLFWFQIIGVLTIFTAFLLVHGTLLGEARAAPQRAPDPTADP